MAHPAHERIDTPRRRNEPDKRNPDWSATADPWSDAGMTTDDDIKQWLDQRRVRLPAGGAPVLIGLDHAIAVIESATARIREGEPGFPRGWHLHGRPGTGKIGAHGGRPAPAGACSPRVRPCDSLAHPRAAVAVARVPRDPAPLSGPAAGGRLRGRTDRSWTSDSESKRMLYAALEGLDTLGREHDPRLGPVVIATTNRRSSLDPALLRAGRLGDVQIACPLPGRRHRLELLQHFLAPWPTDALDLEQAADQTTGWSPAQIKGVVGEAAGRALARSGRGTPITQADILESIRGQGHREREDEPELVAERLQIAAAHEAGHVAVSCWLGVPVTAVQLRASGDGFTQGGREDHPRSEHELRASLVDRVRRAWPQSASCWVPHPPGAPMTWRRPRASRSASSRRVWTVTSRPSAARRSQSVRRGSIDEPLGDHVLAVLAQARERAETIVAIQRDAIERLAERLIDTPVLAGRALQQAIAEAGLRLVRCIRRGDRSMDLRSLLGRRPDQRDQQRADEPERCRHDDDPDSCLSCLLDDLWPPVDDQPQSARAGAR